MRLLIVWFVAIENFAIVHIIVAVQQVYHSLDTIRSVCEPKSYPRRKSKADAVYLFFFHVEPLSKKSLTYHTVHIHSSMVLK